MKHLFFALLVSSSKLFAVESYNELTIDNKHFIEVVGLENTGCLRRFCNEPEQFVLIDGKLFIDKNFKKVIVHLCDQKKMLDLSQLNITELDMSIGQIHLLSDLSKFPKTLETLIATSLRNYSNDSIDIDLNPLKIKRLVIDEGVIQSVNNTSKLPATLESLILESDDTYFYLNRGGYQPVFDISGIDQITTLKELVLSYQNITGFNVVTYPKNLEKLTIYGSYVNEAVAKSNIKVLKTTDAVNAKYLPDSLKELYSMYDSVRVFGFSEEQCKTIQLSTIGDNVNVLAFFPMIPNPEKHLSLTYQELQDMHQSIIDQIEHLSIYDLPNLTEAENQNIKFPKNLKKLSTNIETFLRIPKQYLDNVISLEIDSFQSNGELNHLPHSIKTINFPSFSANIINNNFIENVFGFTIELPDVFLSEFEKYLSYLLVENLPKNIKTLKAAVKHYVPFDDFTIDFSNYHSLNNIAITNDPEIDNGTLIISDQAIMTNECMEKLISQGFKVIKKSDIFSKDSLMNEFAKNKKLLHKLYVDFEIDIACLNKKNLIISTKNPLISKYKPHFDITLTQEDLKKIQSMLIESKVKSRFKYAHYIPNYNFIKFDPNFNTNIANINEHKDIDDSEWDIIQKNIISLLHANKTIDEDNKTNIEQQLYYSGGIFSDDQNHQDRQQDVRKIMKIVSCLIKVLDDDSIRGIFAQITDIGQCGQVGSEQLISKVLNPYLNRIIQESKTAELQKILDMAYNGQNIKITNKTSVINNFGNAIGAKLVDFKRSIVAHILHNNQAFNTNSDEAKQELYRLYIAGPLGIPYQGLETHDHQLKFLLKYRNSNLSDIADQVMNEWTAKNIVKASDSIFDMKFKFNKNGEFEKAVVGEGIYKNIQVLSQNDKKLWEQLSENIIITAQDGYRFSYLDLCFGEYEKCKLADQLTDVKINSKGMIAILKNLGYIN